MKLLPPDFEKMMIASYGESEYKLLSEAIGTTSPTSIRINSKKANTEEFSEMLSESELVAWCPDAFYLKERPQFTFDPLLHAGCYYVQEASSMYIGKLLRHYAGNSPVIALDACAAPGGKSTLALSSLPDGSLLVANEYVRQRSQILAENLIKWGNPNIIVTNSDTKDFTHLPSFFDAILCDAPCSGEGMFRKDEKAIEDWSLTNVNLCQNRQREILGNLWTALRPGGILIYSTCTFNQQEDEENALWIQEELGGKALPLLPLNENSNDCSSIPNGHFFPHLVKGEGFFVSIFKKEADDEEDTDFALTSSKKKKKDIKGKNKPTKIPSELTRWIENADVFQISETAPGTFTAFPAQFAEQLAQISNTARLVHHGIQLATMKGKNLQPCHSLAMSLCLSSNAFPAVEVDYNQAIAYLRTEAIVLPADAPTGFVLITYKQHVLGFAKNIGNRANNLYPSEWKIKSTFVPRID